MHFCQAMESKKLAFPDQILSPRRKVVSGFGLGVVVSVIVLTVMLLNCSLKTPIITPMFQGFTNITSNSSLKPWPFSFSTPSSSSSSGTANITSEMQNSEDLNGEVKEGRVQDKTHDANMSNSAKLEDFLVPNGEGVVLKNTHSVGDVSEKINNGSSTVEGGDVLLNRTHEANAPEVAKNGNFTVSNGEEMVTEKTHLGNLSEIVKNGSIMGEEGRLVEKMPQGNSSQEGNSSKISPQESVITEVTSEGQLIGQHSNQSFLGKSLKFPENVDDGKVKATEKMGKGSYEGCDIFNGRWVRDDSKPYYPAGSCPHIDRDFDCYLNGRPDDGFLKWKWQPNGCDIPSLNATDFLERLRGKKLIFVGDSLNRNMWESLVCILRHSIRDKTRVYEISGRTEFKKKGFYAFRFEDYNCTVDFVGSRFLVRESSYKGRNGTFETLRLDLMDQTTSMYHDADVVIFNTGHWWTHEKTSRGEDYYQEGNYVHPRLKVLEAYKRALTTWARWVDKNIDPKRTQVFFRGYSVTHFRGGPWNSGGQCNKEVDPIFNETYLAKYPSKMRALQYVLQDMKTPVIYLNISRLTDYRKDAHPSIYRMEYKTPEERISAVHSQDCSHWCLPGVPDTWNELLYASLLKAGRGSWRS